MGRTWNEDTLNFFGIARVSYPKHIVRFSLMLLPLRCTHTNTHLEEGCVRVHAYAFSCLWEMTWLNFRSVISSAFVTQHVLCSWHQLLDLHIPVWWWCHFVFNWDSEVWFLDKLATWKCKVSFKIISHEEYYFFYPLLLSTHMCIFIFLSFFFLVLWDKIGSDTCPNGVFYLCTIINYKSFLFFIFGWGRHGGDKIMKKLLMVM